MSQEAHLITSVTSLESLLCQSSTSTLFSIPKAKAVLYEGDAGAESWCLRGGSDDSPTFS